MVFIKYLVNFTFLQRLSREKFAEQSGLSSSLIYEVESGEKTIGLTALIQIASALNVSLDDLVFLTMV